MGKSRQFSIEPQEPRPDTRSQYDRFVQLARELGADDDEDKSAFKEKLGVIARQKLKGEPKRNSKKKD